MNRSEMQLDHIMLDDQKNYIAFTEDLANAGMAINSAAYELLRTGDIDCLYQIKTLLAHTKKHVAHIQRMFDRKKDFDRGYAIGHQQGYHIGSEKGYEEGVRDARQEFPQLEPHLERIAGSGAGLMIVHIPGGAGHDR